MSEKREICPLCQAHIQWLKERREYGCPRCAWTIKRRMALVKMTMTAKSRPG